MLKGKLRSILVTLAVGLPLSTTAADFKDIDLDENIGIEVVRDALELTDLMRIKPDPDTVDTALIFSNPRAKPTLVVCWARDADGTRLGRSHVIVPGNGLRFIRAQDLSRGIDFLGMVQCKSRNNVVPSAFVVGAGFSDSPVVIHDSWNTTTMRFPVVASY